MTDSGHLQWNAEALWETLEPLLPGLSVEVVARAESTNTQLLERARRSGGRRDQPITVPDALEGDAPPLQVREQPTPFGRRADDTQPCLLVAEHQTRGRGRMGRGWQSSAGASLTFSLSLAYRPREWSGLSLAVGVALAEALDPLADGQARPRIGLKWPNDLWLLDADGSGRKLGGVLIETVALGSNRMTVIGVGINLLPQPTRDLQSGFACLQELQADVTAPHVLHAVAKPLVLALQRFEQDGFAAVAEAYAKRDLLLGHSVLSTAPGVPEGVAEGVGPDGSLRVRAGDQLHLIGSGEVSVRLQGDPPPETAC